MWSQVIYNNDYQLIHDKSPDRKKYKKFYIDPIAEGLYKDFQHLNNQHKYSDTLNKEFRELTKTEKSFWYDFVSEMPKKIQALNFFIRPFEDFCRTCIITNSDIDTLVRMDYDRYCRVSTSRYLTNSGNITKKRKVSPSLKSFQGTIKDWKSFSLEMNYLIPAQLKKIGYEIIRPEEAAEIQMVLVKKLARAIHSRYLHEIRNQNRNANNYVFNNTKNSGNQYATDFDDLPDEIKYSNIDNAAHIPTKLLSIGYKIRQVKKDYKPAAVRASRVFVRSANSYFGL